MGTTDTAIEVEDLAAAYGDAVVLEAVSLDVRAGEVLVIMGQSGCGKSTLLRHMIGLQKPLSGRVAVNGKDVTAMSEREYRSYCRSVGVLFQSGGLFNSMTVAENVAFPLREHTQLADPVVDIVVRLKLNQVGLRDAGPLMPSELSGGMRKRAGLARALALDPAIVFLDEPTTGLDPIIAAGIDKLILDMHALYHSTMVVVARDIAGSMTIADRIAIFSDSRLVEIGTPEQIQSSQHPYVRQFLERRPDEEPSTGLADLLA